MPDGLRHLKPLLIGSIETALNRYLALDPHADRLLAPLAGKTIAIHVASFDETIFLAPGSQDIRILDLYQGEVDATLSGSLAALGLLGLSATPMHALYRGDVVISGDTATASRLQRLFARLDIDLENQLAAFTGPAIARDLGRVVRGGRDWLRHAGSSFRENLQEYLQEETRDLPARPEAEILFRQIDDCRSDYDRLQARYQRLQTALANVSEPTQQTGPEQ